VNGRETVSPGQYTNMGPFNGSPIYVIAHAVICGPWEKSAAPKPESVTYESSLIIYPNPFSHHVTFEFISERDAHAVLDIHNVLGQKISTLLNKTVEQGVLNKADFYPVNQPRGIFYYRLKLGDVVRTGKLFYIR